MHYDEVVSAAFTPTPVGTVPDPTRRASVARRLRDAIEPIAMHPVWSRATNQALAGTGLDFLSGYAWGRAAALGEPSAGVVVSSFAVFEPGMITSVYEQGRQCCGREEMLSTRADATTASLVSVLDGVDVSAAAGRLRDAVINLPRSGRPLYAGLTELPFPDEPEGVLWRSAELVREHRGDSHIAACITKGLDPVTMNILTELWVGMPLGSYTGTRGWTEDTIAETAAQLRGAGLLDGDQLSDEGLALRKRIEDATDRAQSDLVAQLGSGVDELIADLSRFSEICIAAAAFPPNVYKRAAG